MMTQMRSKHGHGICAVIALLFSGVVFTYPVLIMGFPVASNDARIHACWAYQFIKQFGAYEGYPRWSMDMNGGLGSPAFFYYPPLPYLLTAPLRYLCSDDMSMWQVLGMSSGIALVLSEIFALLWLRTFVSLRAATAAAVVYQLMPSHLLGELYMRGAFAEFWGMVWLPLILWGVRLAANGSRYSLITLALAYALLITTHLPTTLIFSAVPLVYAWVIAPREYRRRVLVRTCGGLVLGMGLAGIYLIPALTMQSAVSMKYITAYRFNDYFLFTSNRYGYADRIYLCVILMLILSLVAMLLFLNTPNRKTVANTTAVFWGAVAAFCTFMMTPLANPIWEICSTLQMIQFPWRYLTVLSVAITGILALGIDELLAHFSWRTLVCGQIGWSIILVWLYFTIEQSGPVLWQPLADDSSPLFREVPEYRPRWVNADLGSTLNKFLHDDVYQKAIFARGGGSLWIENWQPRNIVMKIVATNRCSILVRQYYYPGWTACVNQHHQPVKVSLPDGLVSLELPAGEHHVILVLAKTKAEICGIVISVCSCVVAIFRLIWMKVGNSAP